MGGWSRKWQFSLTLWYENVLTYVLRQVTLKSLKTPLHNIKMVPRSDPQVVESCQSPAQKRTVDAYPPVVLSWCKTDETGQILASDYPGFFE